MSQSSAGEPPIPPYEGRRESADVDNADERARTAPTSEGPPARSRATEMKAPDPDETATRWAGPRRRTSSQPRNHAATLRPRTRVSVRRTCRA